MAKILKIKSVSTKLQQSEIAKEMAISTCTLQRYRRETKMLSPSRLPPSNTNARKQKTSNHTELDPQMTVNDLKKNSNDFKMTSNEKVK